MTSASAETSASADSLLFTSWSTLRWIMLSGLLMLVIVVAIGSLLAVQWVIAQFRRRSFGSRLVHNTPILLVRDGEFIKDALTAARVTRSDIYAKLRQANVHRMGDVIAVVHETTGDISVVHGEGRLDAELFDNVRQFRPDGPLTPDCR